MVRLQILSASFSFHRLPLKKVDMKIMIRLSLVSLVLFSLCSLNVKGQGRNAASQAPFVFKKGLVIVEAKIKDNVSVKVVLATGVEYSLTDPSYFEKYKLSAYYTADGPVTGRNDKIITYAPVSSVTVGNSKSKNLNMRLASMSGLSDMLGEEIFATLGADFFEGQIVQFDFKEGVVRFFDKLPEELNSKNANANHPRLLLRMAPKAEDPFRKTFQLPSTKDALLNGQKASMIIDTGTATNLALSSAAAKKLGLTLPAENQELREERIALKFEAADPVDVQASIYAKGTSGDQHLSKYGMVAGSGFLHNFVAWFDFRKGLIVLE